MKSFKLRSNRNEAIRLRHLQNPSKKNRIIEKQKIKISREYHGFIKSLEVSN
jgi:hypothetical protein